MSSKRKAEKDEASSSDDSDAEARKKIAKKEAKKKAKEKESGKNNEGEHLFQIGKKRNVNVREFKGKVLIDIREYYEDDAGNMKPGKKGISLQVDQWEALKEHIAKIDEAIEELK
ncbi:activated RNA polymerase II transcriptional coactivator p15 [Paramuricea clavata]|uniref:Activated RNA polymerase II transcriptional coactivator p15 n=2 Tax=Paramuricea clavata TaxID=317549 RepID=A0A7D9I8T4_PARCT|nr:activated RNA polymerase II transcriptional coactivator p15 [Paramuricea clavata]